MNEPIIRKGLRAQGGNKAASTTGHSDKNAQPADEQAFENNAVMPGKTVVANKPEEPTKTQDENVKVENLKDARNPDLDHTIPPDYRASTTPAVHRRDIDKSEQK